MGVGKRILIMDFFFQLHDSSALVDTLFLKSLTYSFPTGYYGGSSRKEMVREDKFCRDPFILADF